MNDVAEIKLGKHLGVVDDRRTFMASAIMIDEVRVPPRHRVGGQLKSVPLFGNDRYGDCVFASQCHAIVTMERSASQRELPLSEEDALSAYGLVTGFRREDPSTDNGAYELDGLNNWRQRGLGREKDATTHVLKAFAAVDWTDRSEACMAHYVFGGLKICAGLPLSAADQVRNGQAWDVVEGPRSRWGSWGGHSMYSFAYDEEGLIVWTWGEEQKMTWEWVDAYVDESYALVSEDYFRRAGKTPQGFDADKLDRLLRGL